MFMHFAPASTPSEYNPAQQAPHLSADAEFHRQALNELIEMGLEFARIVTRQAKAQAETQAETQAAPAKPGAPPAPDLTLQFERISRAVRRTILLAKKLAEPAPAARDPAKSRLAARKRIIREVEDSIEVDTNGADAEALRSELLDRLDAPDLDDDIAQRPVAEIIADIRRDLGIDPLFWSHPWKRRTPADIDTLCAQAAAPPAATRRTRPDAPPTIARRRPPRPGSMAELPQNPGKAIAKVLQYSAILRRRPKS